MEPDWPKNVKFPGGNFAFFGFFLKTRKCAETLVFTTLSGGRRVPKRTPSRRERRLPRATAEKTGKNGKERPTGPAASAPDPIFVDFALPAGSQNSVETGPERLVFFLFFHVVLHVL